jgi:SAM-dependent methyltransferase
MEAEALKGNHFDDVRIDIRKAYSDLTNFCRNQDVKKKPYILTSMLKRYFRFFLVATGLYRKALFANLILGWHKEFQDYWVNYLGNRPMVPADFHYLRNIYRSRYQALGLTDNNPDADLASYQDYRNIYSTFGAVWHTALIEHESYRYAKYIKKGAKFLEFGCGVGPITKSFKEFYPEKNMEFVLADIEQFTFHYACWRFRNDSDVTTLTIDPALVKSLPDVETYDVICINTVFEHLRTSLQTAKYLYTKLRPKGIFIFDYILLDEVDGHDTPEAQEQRVETLNFIKEHYVVLYGNLDDVNGSVSRTVVQKRV